MTERRCFRLLENEKPAEIIVQDAPIFGQGLGDALHRILGQLDAISFVNFAQTCKDTYDLCLNAKGIQIPFGRRENDENSNDICCSILICREQRTIVNIEFHKSGGVGERRLFTETEIEGLIKMPFVIVIGDVAFSQVPFSPYVLKKLSRFLHRFPRVVVDQFTPILVRDWSTTAQFVQEFSVRHLINDQYMHGNELIPTNLLRIILDRVENFCYEGDVPDDVILAAKTKYLSLHQARISTETFNKLLKKFHAGDFVSWAIGREEWEGDFFEACWEVIRVRDFPDIDAWDKKPTVLYNSLNDSSLFRFLRTDGTIDKFNIDDITVKFGNEFF